MSENDSDQKAGASATSEPEAAALPHIDAPALSPVAIETPTPVEAPPVMAAAVETDVAEDVAATPVAENNASQRFRATAAAQIAAARQRLEQRNASSVMAVALIASLAGGGGTLVANNAIAHFASPTDHRASNAQMLQESLARIESDIAALRGKFDRMAELSASQAGESGDRLERIEKAQADPAAKISKLVEMVEKLRFANVSRAQEVSSSSGAAAGDVTGSIKSSGGPMAGGKTSFGKASLGKAAVVEGWTLIEVDRDAALLEGKRGLFETYVGDTIPGVGRVESFRKQDGRWVVVTAKGLIVSR